MFRSAFGVLNEFTISGSNLSGAKFFKVQPERHHLLCEGSITLSLTSLLYLFGFSCNCLCWTNNSYTFLLKSKPVKQEVSCTYSDTSPYLPMKFYLVQKTHLCKKSFVRQGAFKIILQYRSHAEFFSYWHWCPRYALDKQPSLYFFPLSVRMMRREGETYWKQIRIIMRVSKRHECGLYLF